MFRQSTKNAINGWGQVFRFITPLLLSITLYILSGIKGDLAKLDNHFTNHLSDHKSMEMLIEQRLTRIETRLSNGR